MQFNINEIRRESQAEERGHNSHKVDDETCRLEISRFDLFACPPEVLPSRCLELGHDRPP